MRQKPVLYLKFPDRTTAKLLVISSRGTGRSPLLNLGQRPLNKWPKAKSTIMDVVTNGCRNIKRGKKPIERTSRPNCYYRTLYIPLFDGKEY